MSEKLNINLFLSDGCIQTCSGTKNYAFLNKQVRAFDEYLGFSTNLNPLFFSERFHKIRLVLLHSLLTPNMSEVE